MRRVDILRRAGKNIRRTKIRTVLTALSIAVGSTTIALAIAAGKGGTAYINNIADKLGDRNSLTVTRINKNIDKDAGKPKKIEGTIEETNRKEAEEILRNSSFTDKDINEIRLVKGVKSVSPMFGVSAESVRMEGDKFFVSVVIQSEEKNIDLSAGKLIAGKRLSSGKVIVPKAFVEVFGGKNPSDILGRNIVLEFKKDNGEIFERKFEIVAVDNGKDDLRFNYNNDFILNNQDGLDIYKTQKSNNEIRYYAASVISDGAKSVDQLKNEISTLKGGEFYNVSTFADDKATVQGVIDAMSIGLAGFGVLTIVASVFGIINTQYISVLEKTSQIGLMKSLGMRKSDISKMFRYEAALIGFLGSMIGLMVAYAVTFLNPVINDILKSSSYSGMEIELLQPDFIAWSILSISLVVTSIIAGYLPARKAAKMNPIEALRTE